jgi:hypothetical protein
MRSLWVVLCVGLACGGSATVNDGDGGGGSGASGASGGGGNGASGGGTGASSAFDDCAGPGECVLAYDTCCGTCGDATLDDLAAINEDQRAAYQDALCGDPPPPCPGCAGNIPSELFAYCDAGTCRAADARDHALSACTESSECTLRWGLDCCEGCGGGAQPPYFGLVALSLAGAAELPGLVCGSDDIGCPECEPIYPPDADAVCDRGHCTVIFLE